MPTLFDQVLDPANRHDPYPLYAQLRAQPVVCEPDGSYVVTRYADIAALLQDPRISSDLAKSDAGNRGDAASSFIQTDPPDHDRLRAAVIAHFDADLVAGLADDIHRVTAAMLDAKAADTRIDVVADFAYPLPVAVIARILGIPDEDRTRFHAWADAITRDLDPSGVSEQERRNVRDADAAMTDYITGLVRVRTAEPGDDMVSKLIAGSPATAGLTGRELVITIRLLLIAGHETTVNLITNGTLTLLRNPEVLARLRAEPELVDPMVEELLRFEPPVQMRVRTALADIPVAGTTIPRGATVVLLLASGSRDPRHFADPDRFVPNRPDNEHLGFGGGMHYCVGAPLARLEARIALTALADRLEGPRLVVDPPPYRTPASLRGAAALLVDVDRIRSGVGGLLAHG